MRFFILAVWILYPSLLFCQGILSHGVFSVSPLVITEIMADPDPSNGLPVAEFTEIFNRDSVPVNLQGWTLFEGSSKTLPPISLLPGNYLIICAHADTSAFSPYGLVAGISSMSLTNTGEKISIRNPSGVASDSVTYSDSWYGSSYKKDGGWSLERVDPRFPCLVSANWKASVNPLGGTPGKENSVNGIFADNIPPLLLRAYCPDSLSVTLVFSEALNPDEVDQVGNYTIINGPQVASASFADPSQSRIQLQMQSNIQRGVVGMVSVSNISDCSGNEVKGGNKTRFAISDSIVKDEIIINEVLFNPYTGGFDFVELYNNGSRVFDLSQCRMAGIDAVSGDISKVEIISSEKWLLFPGDHIALTENPFAVATFYASDYPFGFLQVPKLPSMNTDAGHVALLYQGERLDEFRYDEDFHYILLEDRKGVSLEKIHPTRNSMDANSWHSASSSVRYATPGRKNSMFSIGAENSQEVSVYPEIFSPDQDGIDDLVTFAIRNNFPGTIGNVTIYNSRGYVVFRQAANRLLATTEHFTWNGIHAGGQIAQPGIYVALIELIHLSGTVKHIKLPFVLAQGKRD
jgi:hypothetical protein